MKFEEFRRVEIDLPTGRTDYLCLTHGAKLYQKGMMHTSGNLTADSYFRKCPYCPDAINVNFTTYSMIPKFSEADKAKYYLSKLNFYAKLRDLSIQVIKKVKNFKSKPVVC